MLTVVVPVFVAISRHPIPFVVGHIVFLRNFRCLSKKYMPAISTKGGGACTIECFHVQYLETGMCTHETSSTVLTIYRFFFGDYTDVCTILLLCGYDHTTTQMLEIYRRGKQKVLKIMK